MERQEVPHQAPHHAAAPARLCEPLEISAPHPPDAAVIVLHGLGADVLDFVTAVRQLSFPGRARLRWVFPQAPERAITIEGGCRMRGWYDVRCYERARMDAEGIFESERIIRGLVEREERRGVPPRRVVLAGFSQGGAMALHAGLRYPQRLAGIVALSAGVPLPDSVPRCPTSGGAPILMGHGLLDRVLRYSLGAGSRDLLTGLGYRVEWHRYLAGHAVCQRELGHVGRWLGRTLAGDAGPASPALTRPHLRRATAGTVCAEMEG